MDQNIINGMTLLGVSLAIYGILNTSSGITKYILIGGIFLLLIFSMLEFITSIKNSIKD